MRRRMLLAMLFLSAIAMPALAQGRWATYLRMKTCTDLIPLRDTVWVATREAGLLRYVRSTGIWSSITREPNGLASNRVDAITFDRSGNLFCSVPGKGVSRLDRDGRWTLINAFDGLPSDTVTVMRAQGDTVWIGTTRGLAVWNGSTITGSIPDRGTASPFVDDRINGIAITGDTLFVSSPKGVHLARLSQRPTSWSLILTGLPTGPQLNVFGIATDGRNLLAVASGQNPGNPQQNVLTSFRWFPSQSRWVSEFPANPSIPNFPFNSSVRRLRDDSGVILATTTGGVYRMLTPGFWSFYAGSPATDNGDVIGLEVGMAPDGVAFASSQGVLRSEPAWGAVTPPGPVGNNCRNVLFADGAVYAAYNGEGVARLRDGVWRNYPAGIGCSGPACDTTFQSPSFPAGMLLDRQGRKWIGNWAGPLTRFDDTISPPSFVNRQFTSSNPDTTQLHTTIHAAAADTNSTVNAGAWFGLDSDRIGCTSCATGDPQGIDLYDANTNFIRNFGPNYPGVKNGLVRGLDMSLPNNEMWVGFKQQGVGVFGVPARIGDDITLESVGSAGAIDVFGIAINGDSVWVLAAEGLRRFRASDRSLASSLTIAGPPALASMHPIDTGPDGSVYVGTEAGLRVHRRGQVPVDYTPTNSPLADLSVRGVYVSPQGTVWIGTASGVNSFEPDYVPPAPPKLSALAVTLYPNPAWQTGIGFTLRLKGQATAYEGEIYDLNGRLVHRFRVTGNGAALWGGRDLDQRQVDPGIYFVRVRGGGAEGTSRVVVLR